ncbi:MAG TPA: PEP-CTERM sorting domain-containing protein [Bryobacteraceae bacterium]|jgi:hypothetical protein
MLKSLSVIVISAFMAGAALQAAPIDPVFQMGDPSSGTPLTSNFFTFGTNQAGGGILAFVNESGELWTSLNFQVTLPINSAITCIPAPFFSSCQFSIVTVLPGAGTALFSLGVSNPTSLGGIANHEFFTINLNDLVNGQPNLDPNGSGGWGANNEFTAVANASIPEPATDALFLLGMLLAGMISRRRLRAAAGRMLLQ